MSVIPCRALAGERRRGARYQNLPAVRDRQQACDPIERRSEVVTVALVRLAAVDRHPHEELDRSPIGVVEGMLRFDGGPDRVSCAGKHRHQAVAGMLDYVPGMGSDGGPDDLVMPCERAVHGGLVVLPATGAALDVGEDEGDRTRRERVHVTILPRSRHTTQSDRSRSLHERGWVCQGSTARASQPSEWRTEPE